MKKDDKRVNIDIGLEAKAEVKADFTDTINAFAVEPATVIGSAFAAWSYKRNRSLIQEQKMRAIDDYFEVEKYKQKKQIEYMATQEASKIKLENLRIPLESEISPPIQALDVFYDKEHYRTMLSKLIAATFDETAPIHPSFVEIIKRLTECDRNMIYDLFVYGETLDITVAKTSIIPNGNNSSIQEFTETLLVDYHNFGEFKPLSQKYTEQERSNSVFNLTNLGILTFDSKFNESKELQLRGNRIENISLPEFKFVRQSEYYKHLVDLYEPEYTVTALKVNLFFTSLGYDFYQVCIK